MVSPPYELVLIDSPARAGWLALPVPVPVPLMITAHSHFGVGRQEEFGGERPKLQERIVKLEIEMQGLGMR